MSRVVVFVYDFFHLKSLLGLPYIGMIGSDDVLVVGAPFRTIGPEPESRPRSQVTNASIESTSLELGYTYIRGDHNDRSVIKEIRAFGADLGVILGARVLHREVLEAVGGMIVNIHPGVLPDNRGLHSARWAVALGLPQGVTAHAITETIDGGPILGLDVLPTVPNLLQPANLKSELLHAQLLLLARICLELRNEPVAVSVPPSDLGPYHSYFADGDRSDYQQQVRDYQERYPQILSTWVATRRDLLNEIGCGPRL